MRRQSGNRGRRARQAANHCQYCLLGSDDLLGIPGSLDPAFAGVTARSFLS